MEKWRKRSIQTRNDAAEVLLDMIRPLKPFFSPGHARLHVGESGVHYGTKISDMEGFARILWGLGPLWSQDNSSLSQELQIEAEEWRSWYLEGITHGTDPKHPEYWGSVADYDQKMVEMAALVVAISLSPEKLWNPLSEPEKTNLYQWLNQINLKQVHANNWRFFRVLVNMMFRLLGLPWSQTAMDDDKGVIEGCYTGDGWYYDGNAGQIDYYIPFAMHFYGLLYAKMMESLDSDYSAILKSRADVFSKDFIYWFAANGSEIPYGRSLTYRFAHGAFFSAMGFARVDGAGYGVMKRLALKNLEGWLKRPIFDNSGILTIGYGYPNLFMSERYNGPGSPYWAFKTFFLLSMPEDHPFWQAEEEEPIYQPQKRLMHPHMLITHDSHHHVMAFTAGQHCKNHGSCPEKYEKFVYSNQFGFSVSRGYGLMEGAFDSTLAVSLAGEERYQMRYGVRSFEVGERSVRIRYKMMPGVEVESTIIPCMPWHVRIHRITTKEALDIADGGFSIEAEDVSQVISGKESGKYTQEQIKKTDNSVFAVLPWGVSGVVSLSGGHGELVNTDPNTNLLYHLAILPTIVKRLEPGEHVIVTCVFGDRSNLAEEKMNQIPEVCLEGSNITVKYEEAIVYSER